MFTPRIPLAILATVAFTGAASAASLTTLAGGGSLTQDDIVFDNFFFEDQAEFLGDTFVNTDNVEITTGSDSTTSVRLDFKFDPSITAIDDGGFFEFFLDFDVSVDGTTRNIVSVSLGGGDLFALVDSYTEVIYDLGSDSVEIFEDFDGLLDSQGSESAAGSFGQALTLEGLIAGETFAAGASTGFSMFSLTFELDSELPPPPPPPPAIPLPASLPLLLAAFGGMAALKRTRRKA